MENAGGIDENRNMQFVWLGKKGLDEKPVQNTQLTQQPKNGIEEVNGGSEEVKSTSEGSKENKAKESESKNSQQKEESKIPVMAMPSFLNN